MEVKGETLKVIHATCSDIRELYCQVASSRGQRRPRTRAAENLGRISLQDDSGPMGESGSAESFLSDEAEVLTEQNGRVWGTTKTASATSPRMPTTHGSSLSVPGFKVK